MAWLAKHASRRINLSSYKKDKPEKAWEPKKKKKKKRNETELITPRQRQSNGNRKQVISRVLEYLSGSVYLLYIRESL